MKKTWPLLPLRDTVVFPHMPKNLLVGRPRSLAAIGAANQTDAKEIILVTQRLAEKVSPDASDIFEFGTIAIIEQVLNLPNGSTKILVTGLRRAKILNYTATEPFFQVEVEEYPTSGEPNVEVQAIMRTAKTTFERYVKLNRSVPPEMLLSVNAMEDADRLADALISALNLKLAERQELLELVDVGKRLERIYKSLLTEIEFLQVEKKLKHRVKRDRESNKREYWLNEQMKAIQKELGDKDSSSDIEELAKSLADKELTKAMRTRAEKELRKLSKMNQISAEATVIRNYLDWVLALPWVEYGEEQPTIEKAAEVLDADHYGLFKVKERILEYLAVGRLVDKVRGPILCLVGPPGVGKTSLVRSIARATDRPFVKMALGGVRDEAEIRGHRRTYIGAMPGKLIHAMKRAGRKDPVLLMDEIDKMSNDFRGDPASALLEVLDHEQNHQFQDHYLDEDYDLSHVMFICTANSLQGIPLPMRDRLEIIQLSGYTENEKIAIGRRYLLPRQMKLNGLQETNLTLSDKALQQTVQLYTKESGVRELERQVAKMCRKVARRVVLNGPETQLKIVTGNLSKVLGIPRYTIGQREKEDTVGLVKGLAVSPWGGELLNIEVATVPGKGKFILTGRLGDWLKESGNAAFTYIRSRAAALQIDPDFHETTDFHIHYPGNALKTDGPSAGIAMATALVSAITGIPVRADTAMTGEITLRGRVLPIGGLKEKVLAAHRGGITRVLIPEQNRKDIEDLPAKVLQVVEIIPVSHMDRVLKEALSATQVSKMFGSHGTESPIALDSEQAVERPESSVRGD